MCILHFMEPLFQTGHISSVLSSHVWLVAAVLDRIISGDCLVSIFFLADIPTADLHSLSLWVGWTVGMSHRAIIWGFLCFSSQLDFLSLDFRSFPHFCLVLLVIVGTWTKAYCWHIYLLSPSAYFWPVYNQVCPWLSSLELLLSQFLGNLPLLLCQIFFFLYILFLSFWFTLPSGRRHAPLDCWERGAWLVKFLRLCISGTVVIVPLTWWLLGWI